MKIHLKWALSYFLASSRLDAHHSNQRSYEHVCIHITVNISSSSSSQCYSSSSLPAHSIRFVSMPAVVAGRVSTLHELGTWGQFHAHSPNSGHTASIHLSIMTAAALPSIVSRPHPFSFTRVGRITNQATLQNPLKTPPPPPTTTTTTTTAVPDRDLKSGMVPPALIPPSLIHEFASPQSSATRAPSGGQTLDSPEISLNSASQQQQDNLDQMANQVVWSEWSDWSSCVDKNGVCDPARLHSRLRRCVAQNTGDKVDPMQCKQRYSMQDEQLELSDCSRTCAQQQQPLLASISEAHIMSDAPSILGPHTASPFLVDAGPFNSAAMISSPASAAAVGSSSKSSAQDPKDNNSVSDAESTTSSLLVTQASNGDGRPSSDSPNGNDIPTSLATPTLTPPSLMVTLQQPTSEVSCSNCTSDEICLLLMQQKVPFCAKVKDRTDSCGGWCKGQNQLCQPVGSSAFKCIHDSECLPEEWRCHDSQCIPLTAHCDGHSNCYDNSDERDCPIKK